MSKMSRQKGKRGERELAAELRKLGFKDARRGVQFQGSPDSPDVVAIPGLHIECKRTEALSIYAAMEQAEAERATFNAAPIVAHRRNGRGWLLVVRLKDMERVSAMWLGALGWNVSINASQEGKK